MKIIKLGSNAVAGKDYTLEVPVVVKPAVIRYVSRNLKDLAKSNPDLAIVYTDEQYASLPASIKKKLDDPKTGLLSTNVVEMESAVNPAEEFAGEIPSSAMVSELFDSTISNLDDLTANIASDNITSITLNNKIIMTADTGFIYQNYQAAALPVKWIINSKEDITKTIADNEGAEHIDSLEVNADNGGNGLDLSAYKDKEENLIGYTLTFGFASPDGNGDAVNTAFLLTAIIDMNGAEFFEDSSNMTNGTIIESPIFKDWKKTFNFEVVIHGDAQ
jgi:hypothetical protein